MSANPSQSTPVPPAAVAGTLWNNASPLQATYEALAAALVPAYGAALTPHGELLRAATRVYYDRYNNGFGNGPFTDEMQVLEAHQPAIESLIGAEPVRDFRRAFAHTGLGAKVVGQSWSGDEPLERVLQGVVQVVAAAHAAAPGCGFRSKQELLDGLRAAEPRAVAFAADLLGAADDAALSRMLAAMAAAPPSTPARGVRP